MTAMRRIPNPPPLAALPRRFWRWFGDSSVVDDSGAPRVVYHGTRSPRDFVAFVTGSMVNPETGKRDLGSSMDVGGYLGPHFAEDRDVASRFAEGTAAEWDKQRSVTAGEAGGRVIPVYLSIRNPMVFEGDEPMRRWIYEHATSHHLHSYIDDQHYLETQDDDYHSGFGPKPYTWRDREDALDRMRWVDWTTKNGDDWHETCLVEMGRSARSALRKLGHDGVKYRNDVEGGEGWSWVPTEKGRVKSALIVCPKYARSDDSIMV
jgi:hypothetical protein